MSSPQHVLVAGLDGQAERRLVVKLFAVYDIGICASVKKPLHDIHVTKSDRVGQVRSHSEIRPHLLVWVGARGQQAVQQWLIGLGNGKAERRLIVELFGIDDVGIGACVKQDLSDCRLGEADGKGQVGPNPEVGHDALVGIRACVDQDLHDHLVSPLDGEAQWSLVIEVLAAHEVEVMRARRGDGSNQPQIGRMYRSM